MTTIVIISVVSCVSIRKNYLGYNKEGKDIPVNQSGPTFGEKQALQRQADSIVRIISGFKALKQSIPGRDINLLYETFGRQLNNDRYYNNQLQQGKLHSDSLNHMQFTAALELLSSATLYEKSYHKTNFVRRGLDRGDSGNGIPGHILQKSRNFLYSPAVRRTLEAYQVKENWHMVDTILKQAPQTNRMKALFHLLFRKSDRIQSFFYRATYAGSKVFGNTVGLFRQNTDQDQNALILSRWLQPFDIILMKCPKHQTDRFIPGYFGHAGIWLGDTVAEGPCSDVMKHNNPGNGRIAEALRSGVTFSSLRDFADGDVFLILRIKGLTKEMEVNILKNIRKHIGKKYDFNFDIQSPANITCTELVFLSYDFVDWKTEYIWRRYTISPDDLVATGLNNPLFEIPVFIENGKVRENPDEALIRSLLDDQK